MGRTGSRNTVHSKAPRSLEEACVVESLRNKERRSLRPERRAKARDGGGPLELNLRAMRSHCESYLGV